MSGPIFPHTGLLLGDPTSIAISGPHIQVIQTQTGKILHSTASFEEAQRNLLLKSGGIRCFAANRSLSTLVTAGDDKKLRVWKTEGLEILNERELAKKPTAIQITHDEQSILVSDKFGDVFSYPLIPDPSVVLDPDQGKRGTLTSHENPSNGTLILGHTSLLTSFLLTADEQYIITADRDEHIRVSWYPQGYTIERYCLGHKKFVSAIHIPPFSQSTLISGGGDPELKVWDWVSGKILHEVSILEIVEPFIKVKPPKSKGWGTEHDDDGSSNPVRRQGKKGRRRKGKGKEKEQQVVEQGGNVTVEDDKVEEDEMQGKTTESASVDVEMVNVEPTTTKEVEDEIDMAPELSETEQKTLVINRIDSVDRGAAGRFILFSAVGCTALFQFAFPSKADTSPTPTIQAFDLGKPVVDFVVGIDSLVWVLVDSEWSSTAKEGETKVEPPSSQIRLLGWSGDNQLCESLIAPPLLSNLNSKCLLPATQTNLKTLDLYSPLASMPKNVDPEHAQMITEDLTELAMSLDENPSGPPPIAKKQGRGKGQPEGGLTQREVARLKNKRALLAKIQEQQKQTQSGSTPEVGTNEEGEEDRESKKVRDDEYS